MCFDLSRSKFLWGYFQHIWWFGCRLLVTSQDIGVVEGVVGLGVVAVLVVVTMEGGITT